MNQYANFGALGFRIAAILLVLYSLIVSVIGTFASGVGSPVALMLGVVGIVAGLVLFAVAPSLGRLAARGLSNATTPPNER